ncbi:MAG TPA: DNA mismatch repair endonuclease MutL [Elusimicrobiota bacterium]|jgi:DNA mismatch repair protein MutL|nr:DNA mismatch repair endonuclease MutL [Elusimicrobiota bacterium]
MPSIRRLPPEVASRIAAGEVVERPASVLKELIENSIDAGARRIDVACEGAGRKLLRVADDGCGMGPEDCRVAFERHATSKIKDFEDLDSLATFGFRGEALFAVCAVAKVALTSTPKGSRKGWRVEADAGKVKREHEAPPVEGTVVEVRDLFHNTPARAKFLKSDASERAQLARVIEEAALANPAIAFHYKSEGRATLDFPARTGDEVAALRARAQDVLGAGIGSGLLLATAGRPGLSLRALVSATDSLTSSRGYQLAFVNRRPVSNRTVQQALYRAYEPFRERNRHPAAVLFLEVPADQVDVNVHPTKREVRFRSESAVYESVSQAVSKVLLEAKGIPTLDSLRRVPAAGYPAADFSSRVAEAAELPVGPAPRKTGEERPWFDPGLRYLGQIERAYLVFEVDGGLLMVDQHAAQERVLFERYMRDLKGGRPAVQKLMLPVPVELPASAVAEAAAKAERLKAAGFEVEPYGKTILHVTAIPGVFASEEDVKDLVHRAIDGLASPSAAAADVKYHAAATVACKAAVKAHDPLSELEALRLLKDLRACEDGTCCPHGRPAMLSFTRDELARRFKRPGAPPR